MLFFFIWVPRESDRDLGCTSHQEVYSESYKGLITDKYRDSHQHNDQAITYLDQDKHERVEYFFDELQYMYDSLQVGDSIFKEKNTINYKIKSKVTGQISFFSFQSKCKDSLRADSLKKMTPHLKK